MCEEKKAEAEDKDKTYAIYDKEFLQELDKIAQVYPVDFYTEFSPDYPELTKSRPENVLFRRFIEEVTAGCHSRTLRGKPNYTAACPTQYIRWHYSDVRYMKHTVEHYAFYHKIDVLDWLQDEQEIDALQAAAASATATTTLYRRLREAAVLLQEELFQRLDTVGEHPIYQALYQSGGELFTELMGVILRPSPPSKRHRDLFNVYATHVIKGESSGGISVLYKQLKKFNSHLQRATGLSMFLSSVLEHVFPELYTVDAELDRLSKPCRRLLLATLTHRSNIRLFPWSDPLFRDLAVEDILAFLVALRSIRTYFFVIQSLFVEVYAILRMLKPPATSSSPYLVLGYFGGAHAQHMASILEMAPYFHYEVVYVNRQTSTSIFEPIQYYSPTPRCLVVDQPISLVDDLDKHAARILAVPEHQAAYAAYQNRIMEEEAGRTGVAPSRNRFQTPLLRAHGAGVKRSVKKSAKRHAKQESRKGRKGRKNRTQKR
jgi:hypothetical protein